ncbi:DUF3667 domain-containing protein [Aquimarina mycalae]|uniref:DUF3667 domain-containing protein n=1 Tax=Aquimarina mycalae TaxID=3040073 RepID=UPI00403B247A
MDKGFLFNLKYLIIAPKKTILNYIQGKRKRLFNPISYAIITITIYLIIQSQLGISNISSSDQIERSNPELYSLSYKTGQIIAQYSKFFWLLNILFLSLFTRLFFKRFNFFEHLAINSLIVGHSTLFGIMFYVFKSVPPIFNPIIFFYILFLLYMVFYTKGNRFEIIVASIFSVFFSYLLFYIIPLIVIWLIELF